MGLLADFIYVERVRIWSSSSGPYFRIWTGYREIWSISPYSVRMRENADQRNSEYGHFSRILHLLHNVKVYHYMHIAFQKKTYIFQADITLYFDTLEYSVAFAKSIRNVFRTQSNIYKRVFLSKTVNCF